MHVIKRRQSPSYKGRRSSGAVIPALVGSASLVLSLIFSVLPGVRFSAFLFFGIAALCLIWLIVRRWGEISLYGKLCKWLFLVIITALTAVLLTLEIMVISESGGDDPEAPVSAVIVLGAGVNGERPSLSLQTRIDAAAAYLNHHPGVPAVLTGGKGSGEQITEAEAMFRGLTAQGIPGGQLLLEEQAANTAQNFAYSTELLVRHGVDTGEPIAVISNDFHLFRAKLIAGRAGLAETVGIPAELPWWLSINYFVREAFASVKTLLFD